MIWFMTTVHVRANQTTVDWAEGAEFVCERTPFVDNLIQHGGLTELDAVPEFSIDQFRTDSRQPYVKYRDSVPEGVVDAQDKVAAAYADENSSSEERQDAEKILVDAQANLVDSQADTAAAQENLNQARADSTETLAELNTELDNEHEAPKPPRTRRKSS